MPGLYTITEAVQGRTYPNKHGGNLVVWRVGLENAQSAASDGLFELHKKEGNEPRPGDVLDVERSQEGEFSGEKFVRLFLAKPKDGGGSQSGGDPPDRFDRKPEHPRNEARMIHTSALSAAPAYYELLRTEGVIPQAENKAQALNVLTGIAAWLADSYQGTLSAHAVAPESQQQALPEQEVPADSSGLGNGSAGPTPAPAGVPDDIPFHHRPAPDREARSRNLFPV